MRRGFVAGAVASMTLLAIVVVGCSKSDKAQQTAIGEVVPAGSPMDGVIRFEFAVYLVGGGSKGPQAALREEIEKNFKELKLVTEIPSAPSDMVVSVRMERNVRQKYAPPRLESLNLFGYGLTPEQAQALQTVREAMILDFAHPKAHVWDGLRTANELIEKIARDTNGLVWDEETREVFTPDAWSKRRLVSWKDTVPEVALQTVVHLYPNGEYDRAISLGMIKMGLPDVFIEAVPKFSGNQAGNIINLFDQLTAEGSSFDGSGRFTLKLQEIKNQRVREERKKALKENSTGVMYLSLKRGAAEEGDPHNRLIELSAERYDGPDVQAKQDRMIGCFFGWSDAVRGIEHTDEVLEASRKARGKLPEIHKTFDAGLQPGEYILVKAPFRTIDNSNEWMWVEVIKWNGKKISGVLENTPDRVPQLHSGQMVEVDEREVFDYVHRFADQREEGNTTGDIIGKLGNERPIMEKSTLLGQIDPGCTPK